MFKKNFLAALSLTVFLISLVSPVHAADKIKTGSSVRIEYTLEADGQELVKKDKPEEMVLVVGTNVYPPAFEKQLSGMKEGDKKSISLSPEQAFGPLRPELIKRVQKTSLPPGLKLVEGQRLASKESGRAMRVAKIMEDSVVFDENHPLAGKALKYSIRILKVS